MYTFSLLGMACTEFLLELACPARVPWYSALNYKFTRTLKLEAMQAGGSKAEGVFCPPKSAAGACILLVHNSGSLGLRTLCRCASLCV